MIFNGGRKGKQEGKKRKDRKKHKDEEKKIIRQTHNLYILKPMSILVPMLVGKEKSLVRSPFNINYLWIVKTNASRRHHSCISSIVKIEGK
jgi:hypothetical protein